jgi:exopolysaccharide production protein ExoQ
MSRRGGEDEPLFGEDGRTRAALMLAAFVLLIFSEAWMKPFNGGGVEPAETGLIRSLYYPGYLAGLALAAFSPSRVLVAMARTPLVWLLVAYAFASRWWSIDAGVTERRAIALGFCTFCGLALAAELTWRELTRMLALVFGLLGVGSFVTGALLPSFGRMHQDFPGAWDGLFIEKNGLGGISAETLVFCGGAVLVDRPRRWVWAGAAALGAALLVLSTSKTSLVVAAIGCLALGFSWGVRRGPATAVATTFAGVVGLGALVFAVAFAPDALLGALGKDATLTGRTRIWAAVLRQIATRPHTGFGYGAVWSDQTGWGPVYWVVKQYGARPAYAHNGWLDLWLGLGDYAVWLWAALLVVSWIAVVRVTYRRSEAILALPYLTMFTLNNLTESSIAWYNSISWVMFVIFATRAVTPEPVRAPAAAAARGAAQRGGSLTPPSSRIAAAFR